MPSCLRRSFRFPVGRQTAESPPKELSPFSRNTLNHIARFVIIDSPNFNGRVSGDSLLDMASDVNPLAPQPVDRLATPFLLFAADIDAPGDGDAALRAYTDQLWETMQDDLRIIFGHCSGWPAIPPSRHARAIAAGGKILSGRPARPVPDPSRRSLPG